MVIKIKEDEKGWGLSIHKKDEKCIGNYSSNMQKEETTLVTWVYTRL
jgi:hypothetical protein